MYKERFKQIEGNTTFKFYTEYDSKRKKNIFILEISEIFGNYMSIELTRPEELMKVLDQAIYETSS